MGLANVREDRLPLLQVTVFNKRRQPLSNVNAKMTALVITPDSHDILYMEVAAASSVVAHAIMAAVVEHENTLQDWGFCPDKTHGFKIHPRDGMRIADVKLAVNGHPGIHHFALLAQEGYLIADSDEELWRKLRKKMSCPTRESWGTDLLPKVKESGALVMCESFGLPDNMAFYVLQPDADVVFDGLVGELVRGIGL